MKWPGKLAIKIKLASGAFVAFAIVSSLVTAMIVYHSVGTALKVDAYNHLVSIRETQGERIERYMEQVRDQV